MSEVEIKKEEKELSKRGKIVNLIMTIIQVALIVVCVAISIFVITNPGGYRENPEDCNTNMMLVMTDSMEPTFKVDDLIFGDEVPDETLELGTVVTFAVLQYKQGYYLDTHRIVGYIITDTKVEDKGDDIVVYYVPGSVYDEATALANYPGYKVSKYVTRGDKLTLEHCDNGSASSISEVKDFTIYKEDGSQNTKYDDGDGHYHNEILAVVKDTRLGVIGSVLRFLQDPVAFALIILLPLVLLFAYNIFLIVKMIIADKTEKARAAALEEANKHVIDEEEIKRKAIEEYLASLKQQENNGSEE